MATLTPAQIAGYAKAAGFPADQIATATAVALAESAGRTDARNKNTNGTTDYGLWQINSVHSSVLASGSADDPAANAKMAFQVWQAAGGKWQPWSTYNSQRFRQFMPAATLAAASPGSVPTATPGGTTAPTTGGAAPNAAPTSSGGVLDLLYQLVSGSFWLRIGAFLLGGALMFISLWQLTGAGDVIVQTAGKAAKAAVLA